MIDRVYRCEHEGRRGYVGAALHAYQPAFTGGDREAAYDRALAATEADNPARSLEAVRA